MIGEDDTNDDGGNSQDSRDISTSNKICKYVRRYYMSYTYNTSLNFT